MSTETEQDRRDETTSEVRHFRGKVDYFQTETSEIEDLCDSAGATPAHNSLTLVAPVLSDIPDFECRFPGSSEAHESTNLSNNARQPADRQQLTASERVLLRKHFTENEPVKLPMRHATLAFSERLIR